MDEKQDSSSACGNEHWTLLFCDKVAASVSVSGVSTISLCIRHFFTLCCSWRARAGQFGPR